jgi:glycosyltransferase involved in cell wall biosynthesis
MKILFLWTGNNHNVKGGVAQYRITSPAKYLKRMYPELDIDVVKGTDIAKEYGEGKNVAETYYNLLSQYDIVWMKHTHNEVAIAALFALKKKTNTKIVWDFDDDLFSVRPSAPAYEEYHPGSKKRAMIAAALTYVDAITVSTYPLKEAYEKLLRNVYGVEKPVYVLPNFTDPEEWTETVQPHDGVTIGYHGSLTHNEDLQMVAPSIRRVLEDTNAHFDLLGAVQFKDAGELFSTFHDYLLDRVFVAGGTEGWEGFPQLLAKQKWDIGIAPLIEDTFNRGKSHIKWMEYSMIGIPTIVSKVYPYCEAIDGVPTVEQDKTGKICSSPAQFYRALKELIDDKSKREYLAKNAKEAVLKNWSHEVWIPKWHDVIQNIAKPQRKKKTSGTKTK